MREEIENSLLRPCVHDERYDEAEEEYEEDEEGADDGSEEEHIREDA